MNDHPTRSILINGVLYKAKGGRIYWKGDKSNNWKGGEVRIFTRGNKYPRINCLTSSGKYILRARLVMEKYLGRSIKRDEVVHHKNRDTTDDRIANLQLMTRSEHYAYHAQDFRRFGKWSRKYANCTCCGTRKNKHHGNGLCYDCYWRIERCFLALKRLAKY